MKPRSKKEMNFVRMASELPPLSEGRKAWARGLFPAQALYYNRRGNNCEFWCRSCGHVEPTLGKWLLADYAADKWECPECGAECEILASYNARNTPGIRYESPVTSRYVTLVTTHEGMQVFRTFDVRKAVGRDTPPVWSYDEVYQNWILPDGREVVTSRPYKRGFNHFTWDYRGPWGIGRHNAHCGGYYQFDDVYELEGNWFFPRPAIATILRRNGFSAKVLRLKNTDPAAFARRLLKDNLFEEVVKQGQTAVAGYLLDNGRHSLPDCIHAIRICTRNRYTIKDPSLWFDYLDDLEELGLDTHSPHYLCPRNLRQAHAATQRRVRRLLERKKKEERRKKIAEFEPTYRAMKKAFFGIAFGGGGIFVTVLKSVQDVADEGAAMHHCVFDNGYYKSKTNLLLTARTTDGKRIETVEIDLKKFRVLQSRGVCNKPTKDHQRILALCDANMDQIRRAARAARTA